MASIRNLRHPYDGGFLAPWERLVAAIGKSLAGLDDAERDEGESPARQDQAVRGQELNRTGGDAQNRRRTDADFEMKPLVILPRLRSRLQRDMARWLERRICDIRAQSPIISFTFDDFPLSALISGGAILKHHGCVGTYFASFGLMGRDASTGRIFESKDLELLVAQGHEVGCHTFDHCHSWDTSPAEFEASILRNREAFTQLLPGRHLTSFSYPISCPRPQNKQRTAKYYSCLRGGGQTFNAGKTDMNYMKAFFLEQSRDDLGAIKRVIEANTREHGWLVFATHDVCESPTRFGVTPSFFEQVVGHAVDSGARILPMNAAYETVCLCR